MDSHSDCRLVLCSCPTQEIAETLAHHLVESRLAACVNIVPNLTSIFAWAGKIETTKEVLLILKTTGEAYSRLETTLLENHPYDCPEIIGFPIKHGYRGYLEWITENVSQPH